MTSGARPVSTAPWTTTWPRRGGRRPTVTFIVVDLPAPLRPSKPRSRPSRSESETPCSTWLSPYSASMSASTRASGAKVDLPGTGMGHDVGPRALNDDLTEMEDRDSLGEVEGHVHVVLDHDDRDVARDARHEAQDVAALGDGQAGEGLVEQQEPRSLGERHRDLDAPALAVGGLGEGPIGEMTEADRGERLAPAGDQRVLAPELDERIPAEPRQTEEGQGDVPEERLVREQRDDLVRARHAEVRAPAARHARDVAPEERDRARVGSKLSGDEVEQRGLARAIGADDQAPLSRLDEEIHTGRDPEAPERLLEATHGERAHRPAFSPGAGTRAASAAGVRAASGAGPAPRGRRAPVAKRQRRAVPGTSPSGMKTTITTKMAPRTKFQRSTYALTTFFITTTRAAPTTGPSSVPVPPEITIKRASADDVSATTCGLTNWL